MAHVCASPLPAATSMWMATSPSHTNVLHWELGSGLVGGNAVIVQGAGCSRWLDHEVL